MIFGIDKQKMEALQRENADLRAQIDSLDKMLKKMDGIIGSRESMISELTGKQAQLESRVVELQDAFELYKHQHPEKEEEKQKMAERVADWDALLGYTGSGKELENG